MATNYSPKHFLRQVPNPLLKAFFDRRGELTQVAWDKLGEMDAYRRRIAECDKELEAHLKSFVDRAPLQPANEHQPHGAPAKPSKKTQPSGKRSSASNRPGFDLASELYRICG